MNAWPFVAAAWTLALGGTGVLSLVSWRAMRRAEAAAEASKRQ